jgi:hypothetical protein
MPRSSCSHQLSAQNHLGVGHPLQSVPREIFLLILRAYMKDFFSKPRDPVSDIPAVLHVNHSWRRAVINDPRCWTTIWAKIDTSLPYIRQNPANRKTKARAIQDTLNTYFSRARENLVDITFNFGQSGSSMARRKGRDNLLCWLSRSLPRMRSYNESTYGWESPLIAIIDNLNTKQYCDLIHLRLENVNENNGTFCPSLPKLQTMTVGSFARLSVPTFLANASAPHLSALDFERPKLFSSSEFTSLLKHLQSYPNLQELVLKYHCYGPHQVKDCELVQITSVRRLFLKWVHYTESSFLPVFRHAFPNLSSLVLRTDAWKPRSISWPEDVLPFTSLTSLYLPIQIDLYCDASRFLGLFPNIALLSLGGTSSPSDFSSESPSHTQYYYELFRPDTLHPIIEVLLLRDILPGDSGPSLRCPLLKNLTFELAHLNQTTISLLDRCLELRQNEQLRVSMRSCQYRPKSQSEDSPSLPLQLNEVEVDREDPSLLEGNEMERAELRLLAERVGVYDA